MAQQIERIITMLYDYNDNETKQDPIDNCPEGIEIEGLEDYILEINKSIISL
jgi:hypothetical protein